MHTLARDHPIFDVMTSLRSHAALYKLKPCAMFVTCARVGLVLLLQAMQMTDFQGMYITAVYRSTQPSKQGRSNERLGDKTAPDLVPSLQRCHSCIVASVTAGQTVARMMAPAIAIKTCSLSHKPKHSPSAMASASSGRSAKASTDSFPAEPDTCRVEVTCRV